jgi:predicted nucleic acid-binding protein
MSSALIDTSGWASAFDGQQPCHQAAIAAFKQMRQSNLKIITSNHVIAELVALLRSPLRISRAQIFTTIDTIKTYPHLEIIHIDSAIDAAWSLCKAHPDKPWSLVDCSSFVLILSFNDRPLTVLG